jgi:tripartite-type tricarboxylate transporter receptor subunit TctC
MLALARVAVALAASLAMASAAAQAPIPRSIKIVVPFSAGGSNDVIARAIAGPLSARLGVPVIV